MKCDPPPSPPFVLSRCPGMERRAAVVGESGQSDLTAGCQDLPISWAQAAGSQARSVRSQMVPRPPALGVRRQRQQGEILFKLWSGTVNRVNPPPPPCGPLPSCWCGTAPAFSPCSSTATTWRQWRPSPGPPTNTGCWRRGAAPPTAACASGTLWRVRRCRARTLARRSATWRGPNTPTSWWGLRLRNVPWLMKCF